MDGDKLKVKIERQMAMERLYAKNLLMRRISAEILKSSDELGLDAMDEEPLRFVLKLLTQMILQKRCNIAVLIGIMDVEYNNPQYTASLLENAVTADLIDYSPETQEVFTKASLTQDVLDELAMYSFAPPMIVPPKELTDNNCSGYYTFGTSLVLKDNHTDEDICLDHLNKVNSYRLTLNQKTTNMVANTWRDLDKQKDGESVYDFGRRKKAFEKYDKTSRAYIAMYVDEDVYLTNRVDSRGRTYASGYHINPQGTAWNKAVVEFADKETL